MGSLAEWAMVIVTGVSAYFIVLQLRVSSEQLRTSNKQLIADHERSRRELSVKLLQEWTNGLKLECPAVVALVASLSAEQCDALASRRPLCLDDNPSNRDAVKRCLVLKYQDFVIEKIIIAGKINIDGDYVAWIRFNTIYYLNLLESILVAWNLGVADQSILEDQFRCLKLLGNDLEKFRKAAQDCNAGVDVFPSIFNFVRKISPSVSAPTGTVV